MTLPIVQSRPVRRGALAAGALALLFPLAGCGNDEPTPEPDPTSVSIAPSSAAPPTTQAPATTTASTPPTDPSIAQTEEVRTAAAAVAAAEAAVAGSTVVEVSRDDDDGRLEWEVTVRVGDDGRELRIGVDGSLLSNEPDSLNSAQRGALPKVTVLDAIQRAEKRVQGGVVDDVELTTEDGQRVWDVSVEVSGDEDWELWIDASSGELVREERD